jgi:Tfp pilus assembly PilM family ATPase
MSWILKNHVYPIGVAIGNDSIQLAQLADNGSGVKLLAVDSRQRPENVEAGSSGWQRWAIEVLQELIDNGKFKGREVAGMMPAGEVFIEHIKMPKKKQDNVEEIIFSEIKHKLPFEASMDNLIMKYVETEDDDILAIVTEREKVNRHLAIYEKADAHVKTVSIWPSALTGCYAKFFGRRKSDIKAVVMLIDVNADCTNVVICRHRGLLLARTTAIRACQLESEGHSAELTVQLENFVKDFRSRYAGKTIERVIFLSGGIVSRDIYMSIAKQLKMPAQMGDCLAAVEAVNPCDPGMDQKGCKISWAGSFGLSLQK